MAAVRKGGAIAPPPDCGEAYFYANAYAYCFGTHGEDPHDQRRGLGEGTTSFAKRSSELTMMSCDGAPITQRITIVLFLFYKKTEATSTKKRTKHDFSRCYGLAWGGVSPHFPELLMNRPSTDHQPDQQSQKPATWLDSHTFLEMRAFSPS
jgi:hypothetical protein